MAKMLKPAIFSGKTFVVDEKVREEIETYLIHFAGPYGEMALSVAFDIALIQSHASLMQARISEQEVEIAIKMVPPINPLKATANSKGASVAMLYTLLRRGVIRVRRSPEATYLLVRVKRIDNVNVPTPRYVGQPAVAACA